MYYFNRNQTALVCYRSFLGQECLLDEIPISSSKDLLMLMIAIKIVTAKLMFRGDGEGFNQLRDTKTSLSL
jgi:hypothetical protein